MYNAYTENTLELNRVLCTGCGMCLQVCPHAVFKIEERKSSLEHPERCMECGACRENCISQAIMVDSGVGCAGAMIYAAVTGKKEPVCGCSADGCC